MAREVVLRAAAEVVALNRRLASPEKLLKRFGAMLQSDARASWQRQGLGEIKWPARYPNASPPFLNTFMALKDFDMGRTKLPLRRFQDRPAGIDTGLEPRSVTFRVVGNDGVEVGTVEPWGPGMQHGGVKGTIFITDKIRKGISIFLKEKKTKATPLPEWTDQQIAEEAERNGLRPPKATKRGKTKRNKDGSVTFNVLNPYSKKLGRFLSPTVTSYSITGYARPFLGVTDTMRTDLLAATEDYFATGNA